MRKKTMFWIFVLVILAVSTITSAYACTQTCGFINLCECGYYSGDCPWNYLGQVCEWVACGSSSDGCMFGSDCGQLGPYTTSQCTWDARENSCLSYCACGSC